MRPIHRHTLPQLFASLAILAAVPFDATAALCPSPRPASFAVVVVVPGPAAPNVREKGAATPRMGSFRERLRAWRTLRSLLRTAMDDGKADRLAKRSLTFGIIAMSTLLMAWLPVLGGILLLGVVPMGVLAIVDGLKARRLGSEKSAGLVLGIVSVSLFVLFMLVALLILVGVLVFLGQ